MKRLAIITTHPIQYNAPLFKILAQRKNVEVKIFYTWGDDVLKDKYDPGFGKNIKWDIPLLEGYQYEFVKNVAKNKGSHHFYGIDNPDIAKLICDWKADAVLVYGWSFKSHLKVMRFFHGKIPVLFRGDSVSLNNQLTFRKKLRQFFLRWVYNHVDIALYVGTHNKNYFIENKVQSKKLVFTPHAVDNIRFSEVCHSNIELIAQRRALMGIGTEDIVLLYAGKFDENKNISYLAKVFVETCNTNVHLILAGNGTTENSLKEQFAGNSNIHFLPFQNQSEMPLLYGMADIFVLPSINETWGLSINEAMACGKAILASEGCGCAIDLVKNGQNGYIFSLQNDDFRNKLEMITTLKNLSMAMGVQSRQIISDWTFEQAAVAIEHSVIQNTNNV